MSSSCMFITLTFTHHISNTQTQATLSYSMLVFIIACFCHAFSFGKTTSSSSTASEQLKYWHENVQNRVPGALLSKLSPLNKDDNEFFTSLASKLTIIFI